MGRFLKPRFVLEHWSGLDPFQPVDGLAIMVDQKIVTQSEQSVHHLPWSMVGGVQESLSCDLTSLVDQLH